MNKKVDFILTYGFLYLNIYGLKYVATFFLILALICIISIIDIGFNSSWGSPMISINLIDFMGVHISPNTKGDIKLPFSEILYKLGLLVLVAEITLELAKNVVKKFKNTKTKKNHLREGFFYRYGAEIRIITLIFFSSLILVLVGYKSSTPLSIEVIGLIILYIFSIIFMKIFKSFDKTADSIVYPKYLKFS